MQNEVIQVGNEDFSFLEVDSPIKMIKEDWRPVTFEVDTSKKISVITELLMECEYGIVGNTDLTRAGKRQTPAFQIEVDYICRQDSTTLSVGWDWIETFTTVAAED